MKPIKKTILESALVLFNEQGFVNVRLQHIADKASISVGNLAYHFKNKEEIILFFYKKIKVNQELLLSECKVLPLFEDIDFLIKKIFTLQQHYSFFYFDTLEFMRAFPLIAEKHSLFLQFQRKQIQFMIEFNASRGSFVQQQYEHQFSQLTEVFCITMDNWMSHQYLNGVEILSSADYCNTLWAILRPLFTDMGLVEFRQMGKYSLISF
ncbi:MAG: TetR family transcriptional regulator [Saprospiraceae bacterium]